MRIDALASPPPSSLSSSPPPAITPLKGTEWKASRYSKRSQGFVRQDDPVVNTLPPPPFFFPFYKLAGQARGARRHGLGGSAQGDRPIFIAAFLFSSSRRQDDHTTRPRTARAAGHGRSPILGCDVWEAFLLHRTPTTPLPNLSPLSPLGNVTRGSEVKVTLIVTHRSAGDFAYEVCDLADPGPPFSFFFLPPPPSCHRTRETESRGGRDMSPIPPPPLIIH